METRQKAARNAAQSLRKARAKASKAPLKHVGEDDDASGSHSGCSGVSSGPTPGDPAAHDPLNNPPQRTAPKQQQQPLSIGSVENQVHGNKGTNRRRRNRETIHTIHERLVLDVNALKAAVHDLELRQQMYETKRLVHRHVQLGSYCKIAQEYLRVFRYGVPLADPHVDYTQDCCHWGRMVLNSEACARQRHFVDQHFDSKMRFGESRSHSIFLFLTQWARYSASHRRLKLEPLGLEVVGEENEAVVIVTAKITAYMTRKTIEMMYPHILSQEELCQKLLGYFIEYPVRLSLAFGPQGKIVQYTADLEFVAPLLQVLGRLDDVVAVCKGALVRNAWLIGAKCQVEVMDEQEVQACNKQERGEDRQREQQEEKEEAIAEAEEQKMDLGFICCSCPHL